MYAATTDKGAPTALAAVAAPLQMLLPVQGVPIGDARCDTSAIDGASDR